MKEKELERHTGLSRRQIIQLQKIVIKRKSKCIIGIAYDYQDDEIKEFVLAKFFKDCGYSYNHIKEEMEKFQINPESVIEEALDHMVNLINNLNKNINLAKEMLENVKEKKKK